MSIIRELLLYGQFYEREHTKSYWPIEHVSTFSSLFDRLYESGARISFSFNIFQNYGIVRIVRIFCSGEKCCFVAWNSNGFTRRTWKMWCIKCYNTKNLLKVDKLTAWTQQILLQYYTCRLFRNNFHRIKRTMTHTSTNKEKKHDRICECWKKRRKKYSTCYAESFECAENVFEEELKRGDKVLDEHLLYRKLM